MYIILINHPYTWKYFRPPDARYVCSERQKGLLLKEENKQFLGKSIISDLKFSDGDGPNLVE